MLNISDEIVSEIRTKYITGCYTQAQLGKMFNVSQSAVCRIVNNRYKPDPDYVSPRKYQPLIKPRNRDQERKKNPKTKKIEFTKKEIKAIYSLYFDNLVNQLDIGKLYNVSQSVIARLLRANLHPEIGILSDEYMYKRRSITNSKAARESNKGRYRSMDELTFDEKYDIVVAYNYKGKTVEKLSKQYKTSKKIITILGEMSCGELKKIGINL